MSDLDPAMPRLCRDVTLYLKGARIHAHQSVPESAQALVIFAHATGRGRANPRNRMLADILNRASVATLLCDLLTSEEEVIAELTGDYRQDYVLQSARLLALADWVGAQSELRMLPIGLFAAGTGAAAAVVAAVGRHGLVKAIAMRGGRPDLAWDYLGGCTAPTLMMAGERDTPVRAMNRVALTKLGADIKDIEVVPGAGHLFLEPGSLERVGARAADWFIEHLGIGVSLRERELVAT